MSGPANDRSSESSTAEVLLDALAVGLWRFRVEVIFLGVWFLVWIAGSRVVGWFIHLLGFVPRPYVAVLIALSGEVGASVFLLKRFPRLRAWLIRVLCRARVRRRLLRAFARQEIRSWNGRNVRVLNVEEVSGGWLVDLRLPPGGAASDVADRVDRLAAEMRCRSIEVVRDDRDASTLELTIYTEEPWRQEGERPWPGVDLR